MDIKGSSKRGGAPTPQNTPVSTAPISGARSPASHNKLHATSPPKASAEKMSPKKANNKPAKHVEPEEDDVEEDDDDLMSHNPELAAAIQEKLGQLIGRSSGYIDALPSEVQRRLKALKNLQSQHSELEAEFREELLSLERKYLDKYSPLYVKRFQIVSGSYEPTDEECEREDSDLDEDLQKATIEEVDDNNKPVNPVKGIPSFWLTAMNNHPMIAELITEKDKDALNSLRDITLRYTADNHGFILEFWFDDNEFFSNKVLTKTYFLQNNVGTTFEDLIYSHAEGCVIDWNKGKDLTVRIETKKQRHKGSKKTRIVKREVPSPSFFRFFSPPKMPSEEEEHEDIPQDIEEQLEQDFELGEIFKTRLVKHAVDWFTGKALSYEDDGIYDDEFSDEERDEEEEGDEDDDDDDEAPGPKVQPGEKPADCQQQ